MCPLHKKGFVTKLQKTFTNGDNENILTVAINKMVFSSLILASFYRKTIVDNSVDGNLPLYRYLHSLFVDFKQAYC